MKILQRPKYQKSVSHIGEMYIKDMNGSYTAIWFPENDKPKIFHGNHNFPYNSQADYPEIPKSEFDLKLKEYKRYVKKIKTRVS